MAWKLNGRSVSELPYKAAFGVIGSWIGLALNIICLIASIYVGAAPVGGSFTTEGFFQQFLAVPTIVFFYIVYKIWAVIKYPEQRPLWTKISNIDVYAGMRQRQLDISGPSVPEESRRHSIEILQEEKKLSMAGRMKKAVTTLI